MKYLSDVVIRQRLTHLISQTVIDDPVKSWLGLSMNLIGPNSAGWQIDFAILTPNAQVYGQKIVISTREVIMRGEAERYCQDHTAFYRWMYTRILKLLEHELRESMFVGGQYVIDPHPEMRARAGQQLLTSRKSTVERVRALLRGTNEQT